MADFNTMIQLRATFDKTYSKYKKGKATIEQLKDVVHQIEEAQKNYDIESQFVEAQMLVHDLTVAIDTEKQGNIENKKARDLVENLSKLVDTVQPHADSAVELRLVGIQSSSTIFMYDFVQKEKPGIVYSINAEETKEKVAKLMKAAPSLLAKNFNSGSLQVFNEVTGMKNEESYEIAKALLKVVPIRDDYESKVTFSINTKTDNVSLDINKEDKGSLQISKSKIYSMVKPEDITELDGKLGIMEEWEENHKIVIIDSNRNNYTINYEPTEENIQFIKDNIGEEVKLKRKKHPEDGRKWVLDRWL